MRIQPILSFAIILLLAAGCKKDATTPEDPKKNADFREPYKGTFYITRTIINDLHPSSNDTFTNDTTINTFQAVIDFASTDSAMNYATQKNMPALHIKYDAATEEYLGIDATGKLYRKVGYNINEGGFTGTDSLYHYYRETHVSNTYHIYIEGKRM